MLQSSPHSSFFSLSLVLYHTSDGSPNEKGQNCVRCSSLCRYLLEYLNPEPNMIYGVMTLEEMPSHEYHNELLG